MARSMINSVLVNIKKIEKNPCAVVDCELTKEFDEIFFISVFLPMMSPNVPQIQMNGSKKSLLKRNVRNFSKRSTTGSSFMQDPHQIKNIGFQYSPSSRPRSSLRAESPSFTLLRQRSSSGNHIKRKINNFYRFWMFWYTILIDHFKRAWNKDLKYWSFKGVGGLELN